jgi:hypothetical protein
MDELLSVSDLTCTPSSCKPIIEESRDTSVIAKSKDDNYITQHVVAVRLLASLKRDHHETKKVLTAFVIAVCAMLVCSSFTIGVIDSFLLKRNVDLSDVDSPSEMIMGICQFIVLFFIIYIILKCY